MRKWRKYLPVATLLFPGGLFIFGAWLAVELIRQGDDEDAPGPQPHNEGRE